MQNICAQAFINGTAQFDGGSKVPGHIGWLDLLSVTPTRDAAQFGITFYGNNAATANIVRRAADGTRFDSWQIDLINDGTWFLRYSIGNVYVASINIGGGDFPLVTATLLYDSISVDYRAPTATSATTDSGGISGDDFDC